MESPSHECAPAAGESVSSGVAGDGLVGHRPAVCHYYDAFRDSRGGSTGAGAEGHDGGRCAEPDRGAGSEPRGGQPLLLVRRGRRSYSYAIAPCGNGGASRMEGACRGEPGPAEGGSAGHSGNGRAAGRPEVAPNG